MLSCISFRGTFAEDSALAACKTANCDCKPLATQTLVVNGVEGVSVDTCLDNLTILPGLRISHAHDNHAVLQIKSSEPLNRYRICSSSFRLSFTTHIL